MKRLFCLLFAVMLFSMTSYAGEWKKDNYGYQYQNDDGSYRTGWYQDVDSKWYYFDSQTGYMLTNAITPDGFVVSSEGVWIKDGEINTTSVIDNSGYNKRVELEVTAYNNPYGARPLGYTLPTTIYYNNEYDNIYGGKITVNNVALSKDGLACITFSSEQNWEIGLSVKCKYYLEDGTIIDKDESIMVFARNDVKDYFYPLLEGAHRLRRDSVYVTPVSVEVYINAETGEQ